MVQFRLCEVASAGALAWIGFARKVVGEASSKGRPAVPREILEAIFGHLDEWETRAGMDDTISLQIDMPAEEFECLGHAFLQLASYATAAADARGYDISPPESDEFFAALSEAVICALEHCGEESTTEFAIGLRNNWPRTDRLMPDGTLLSVQSRFGHQQLPSRFPAAQVPVGR